MMSHKRSVHKDRRSPKLYIWGESGPAPWENTDGILDELKQMYDLYGARYIEKPHRIHKLS